MSKKTLFLAFLAFGLGFTATNTANNLKSSLSINEALPLVAPFVLTALQRRVFFYPIALKKMVSTLDVPKSFQSNVFEDSKTALCFQCLAAYNEGHHHYLWCDIDSLYESSEDLEDFQKAFNQCLEHVVKTSPVPDAEEIFFTDHQGLESIYSEYLDSKTLFDYLEQRQRVIDDGQDVGLFEAWCNATGADNKNDYYGNQFLDTYRGSAKDGEEFAENYYEELGQHSEVERVAPDLAYCIDYERVWSCSLRFDFLEVEYKGESHFFRN